MSPQELVFAYGSNMCSERLKKYGVAPEGQGEPAYLAGYRLRFNKRSVDGSGKANVEPDACATLWGVVYEIPTAQLQTLDRGEGSGYIRERKTVRTSDGHAIDVWVYVACAQAVEEPLRPYDWYKHLLVKGAKEHGLPRPYLQFLEAVDAMKDPITRSPQTGPRIT